MHSRTAAAAAVEQAQTQVAGRPSDSAPVKEQGGGGALPPLGAQLQPQPLHCKVKDGVGGSLPGGACSGGWVGGGWVGGGELCGQVGGWEAAAG